MSTISSKQGKRQGLVDPISVLVCIVLIGTLLIPGSLNASLFNSRSVLAQGSAIAASSSGDFSFTQDEQYWDANCSHGWNSDSTCDHIVLRAQACSIGGASAYCSDYKSYMQKFQNQVNKNQY